MIGRTGVGQARRPRACQDQPMRWLRDAAPELLPLVIAIAVPLAGLVLALQVAATGDRRRGLRIGAATVLGVCVWALVLTA
jgi:hypothetical protein